RGPPPPLPAAAPKTSPVDRWTRARLSARAPARPVAARAAGPRGSAGPGVPPSNGKSPDKPTAGPRQWPRAWPERFPARRITNCKYQWEPRPTPKLTYLGSRVLQWEADGNGWAYGSYGTVPFASTVYPHLRMYSSAG